MTEEELVRLVSVRTGATRKSVKEIFEALGAVAIGAVSSGESVSLPGFGKFTTAHRKARTGRNPKTQEPIEIPARSVPAFRPSKVFKKEVARVEEAL